MKVKHGLPETVIYCKRCVMSNQRPATHPEFRKASTSDTPTSAFGDDGVCDACRYHDLKKAIDWPERERQLSELCDRYRRTDGRYDVVVPGSGGKDSIFVSHLLKHRYNMNPLTVTWAPHAYTDVGLQNMQAWGKVGHDNVLFTPDPLVHAKLTRLAFLNLVNPFQPFILGQKILAPRLARQFGIQLVMYGENQAEIHNSIADTASPLMNPRHYAVDSTDKPLFFGGVALADLGAYGIARSDMQPYLPLLMDEVRGAAIDVHFMSHYLPWSPQKNYYYAKQYSAFESNPNGRSEGTYSKYSSLDDKIDGQHYFTSLIKFGQGRAMNDACRDIRDGHISRDEGVQLVRQFDEEFPAAHFDFFLDYIGVSEEQYWQTIDDARSPHLWQKHGNEWRLRHPCE
jgi:N-acetyl sugar amidotransferase